jgi:hypothetical protein
MNDQRVLFRLALAEHHRSTGRTRHTVDGHDLPVPHTLALAQYEGTDEVYLLYFNESGQELTDTLHDSVEEAMTQAEFEFGVLPGEWVRVTED